MAALATSELATAIHELQPDMREALLMFAVDEMTYQEIADALQVPLGTIRSRIGHARNHIREQTADTMRMYGDGGERGHP